MTRAERTEAGVLRDNLGTGKVSRALGAVRCNDNPTAGDRVFSEFGQISDTSRPKGCVRAVLQPELYRSRWIKRILVVDDGCRPRKYDGDYVETNAGPIGSRAQRK
jgi:hypothetical protein